MVSRYGVDQVRESMVKILGSKEKSIAGSGFIIRADGYLVTCHHVIYQLPALKVEYQNQEYSAHWCQELSSPDKDIAILKIETEEAKAVPIINPLDLTTSSVTVCGFPPSQGRYFQEGFDISARRIDRSFPIATIETYNTREISDQNTWNVLPQNSATFDSYRLDTKVESGTSGGPVLIEELGGVIGVIQSSRSGESYVIRWSNILESLDKLGLEPCKNAVYEFLQEIEDHFKSIRLFHTSNKVKVDLKKQYIPIQVTLERQYKREVETTWGYAESEADFKRAYALKDEDAPKQSQADWVEEKGKHERIMVLADPGMGKSTLLKMEAGSMAQEERQKLKEKTVDDVVFPLFLKLSELDKQEEEIIDAIPTLIRQYYPKALRDDPKLSAVIEPLLQGKLKTGKCALLLDALDEVPRDNRNRLSEKLNRFIRYYPCRVVCTSRIVGYSRFLNDAKEMEIVPFSQKQTEKYIETWFKNAADSISDKSVSAEGLIRELQKKPQVRGLAQNPLLLSLLCSLYQEKNLALPTRRCEVYKEAVDCMLRKWSKTRKSPSEWKIVGKTQLLEELAYQFTCEGKEFFSSYELAEKVEEFLQKKRFAIFKDSYVDELIEELSEEDGLIQELVRESNQYLFLHRTFQEYLTASYLKKEIERNLNEGLALAKEHFWEYDWHETLRLVAGLMRDPIPLLEAIMDEKDDIFSTLLLLAGQCVAECKKNSAPLIAEITDRIYSLWYHYPSAGFIQSTVVALGQAHSPIVEMLQVALNNYDDDHWEAQEQAAKVLGEISTPQAVQVLIQNLNDKDNCHSEAVEALGRISSPETLEVVVKALRSEDKYVRSSAAKTLGEIGHLPPVDVLIEALRNKDEDVRRWVTIALGKIGTPQAVEALIPALNDEGKRVGECAMEALSHAMRAWEEAGNFQAIDALVYNLDSQAMEGLTRMLNASGGRHVIRLLARIGTPQAVEGLINALNADINYGKRLIVSALREIGTPQAIEALIYALNDKDKSVRRDVVSALGEIDGSRVDEELINQVVEALINVCDDQERDVRREVVKTLGEIKPLRAVEALIDRLNDEDRDIRSITIRALGEIATSQAIEALIHTLDHENKDTRKRAAEVLMRIGSSQVPDTLLQTLKTKYSITSSQAKEISSSALSMDTLIQALDDNDKDIRWQAAKALGEIRDPQVGEALIRALKDKHHEVRQQAAEALSKIACSQALQALIHSLDDENKEVRLRVVKALGEFRNPEAVEALIHALNDEDWRVRSSVVHALGKIGNTQAVEGLIDALNDENQRVRSSINQVLGELGKADNNSQAVEGLIQLLDDKDRHISEQAGEFLGQIGTPQAVEALIQAFLGMESWAGESAAKILGRIGTPQAIEGLIQALDNDYLKRDAIEVLSEVSTPQAATQAAEGLVQLPG